MYGEINILAGDFYGTKDTICQGETTEKQRERFLAAYKTLAGAVPGEVMKLLESRRTEIKALDDAVKAGTSTAAAYKE